MNDSDRVIFRTSSPHSAGCRATPGKGAMTFDSTRDNAEGGEGGVVAEYADDMESKLPADEHDPSRDGDDTGPANGLDTFLWQL